MYLLVLLLICVYYWVLFLVAVSFLLVGGLITFALFGVAFSFGGLMFTSRVYSICIFIYSFVFIF